MGTVLALWSLLVIIYIAGYVHGLRPRPRPVPTYRGSPLADMARAHAATERRRKLEVKTVDLSWYVARGRVPAEDVRRAA